MRKRGKYKDICGKKACDRLGLPRNKLYTMRWSNPEAFNYMMTFGDDVVTAYRKYEQHKKDIREKACTIIYWLEDHRLKRDFGRYLADKGIYKTYESFNSSSNSVLYSEKGITKHSTLLIYEKIVGYLFDEFVEQRVDIKVTV